MTPRMRTINEAYNEIKTLDPNTAITPHAIRQLVIEDKIPHIKAGRKYLLNLDVLQNYLTNPAEHTENNKIILGNAIRKIPEKL